jgi:cysteine-rich repeat protein
MNLPPVRCLPLLLLVLGPVLGCEEAPPAVCGDAVVEEPEGCDDGNLWGGDGCTHLCTQEDGAGEQEPNDDPDEASLLNAGRVFGALTPGDRDCFLVSVDEAGAVGATVGSAAGGSCDFEMLVELLAPDGTRITSAFPAADGDCPAIDPDTDTWARYLAAGEYAVCVEALLDGVVSTYSLTVSTVDSCTDLEPLEPDPSQDLEADGIADVCDPDDDNDGVDDTEDNCPDAPNGPDQPFPWTTADDGFVNLWLILGSFVDGVTPGSCEPSPDDFASDGLDAEAGPVLGDVTGELSWFADHYAPGGSAVVRFTDWFSPDAPREAYAFTWIYAPSDRDASLAIGTDDGHKIWLDGEVIGTDAGCHGVGVDAFRYPVSLDAGWHRVLIKVYDGGGGWGLVVRFYETDDETPMTDLGLSIGGPQEWTDNQGDADGDGVGDFCDPQP